MSTAGMGIRLHLLENTVKLTLLMGLLINGRDSTWEECSLDADIRY